MSVIVTVTEALVLRPLLEDRGRITASIRIFVPVDRMKQKCIPKLERRFRKVGVGSQTSDALLGDEVELGVAHDWKRFQHCMIAIALRQVAGGEPLRRGVIIKACLINP